MEIHEIRYFLATVRAKSVAGAAAATSISPASISKAIAKIEEDLGRHLFNRKGRGIEPTESAYALAQKLEHAMTQLEQAFKEAAAHSIHQTTLSICGTDFALQTVAHSLLQEYRDFSNALEQSAPRLSFFTSASDRETVHMTRSRACHLGIATRFSPKDAQILKSKKIPLRTAVRKEHPFAKRKKIDVLELSKSPFAVFTSPQFSVFETEGVLSPTESCDGWRDDLFPRNQRIKSNSWAVLERLVKSQDLAIYAPETVIHDWGLHPLNVSNCHFDCFVIFNLITWSHGENLEVRKLWDLLGQSGKFQAVSHS